jgi:type VI secretion system secreted protein VgrG
MAEMTAVETFLLFQAQGKAKDAFRVASFTGNEAISTPFRYEIDLVSDDHDLDYQSVLGKKGHLTIKGADADRHVHGLVARIEQTGRSEDLSRYRLTLVPSVWPLGLRQGCRIFQKMTVPDIVRKVLKDAGVADDEVKIQVHGEHPEWEYCVQYRESDLAFISRLMEQEGIFYFFEHSGQKAVMRIGDDPADHPGAPDVPALPFRSGSGMAVSEEVVSRFSLAEEVRPDGFAVRDYNFETPTVDLTGTASDKPGLGTEVFDFPGEYDEPAEGSSLAKIRLQEMRAGRVRGTGESSCPRLAPGHTFQIDKHPRRDHNGKFLLLEVRHHGAQPQVLEKEAPGGGSAYSCSFTCIPAGVPYRPPRVTPRPMAQGAQTAVVVGPSGEEIHTDEHGRVKVQFHWDRQGKKDEESSCWIRVAQVWAGPQWGGLFIPRIGQEVIVGFLDGDPDQPIITGAVYNADNPPPYGLPGEKTKSSLKTNTSPGGGGFNEIRFEDAKGSEEIFIHGQKDLNLVIENDESDTIHGNRTAIIDKDESVTIGGSRTENVGKSETISISEGRTESVGKNEDVKIGGTRSLNVTKDQNVTIGQGRTESVGKNAELKVGADRSVTVAKEDRVEIGGGRSLRTGKDLKEQVGDGMTLQVGKDHDVKVGNRFALNAGSEIALKVGSASLVMSRDGRITLKGSAINIKASGDVIIKGSKVAVN